MNKQDRLAQDGVEDPVLFYSPANDYGVFSNFSNHTIVLPDPWTWEPREYLTGEHRYQALKADNQDDHDYVCEVNNPGGAQRRGRQVQLREGWGENHLGLGYYVMFETVLAKFLQHKVVQAELFGTGERHIYEDSPVDDIWGWQCRGDYRGKNLLGKAWMQVRSMI